MADKPSVTTELSRDLSLFHITMMGLGMMIGAGVFIGIGNTIARVGPGGLMLTFALNGVIALFTAMSFAELSSAIPRAGGAYNFARIAFGRGTSFLSGWMEWFASSVAGALYAVVFATYVTEFFVRVGILEISPETQQLVRRGMALVVAGFFLYINYRGARETGKIGALFTLGQMIFILGIAAIGIFVAIRDPVRVANFTPFMPRGWGQLLVTMGFIYVAFEGFEVIAQAGDEAIAPKSNIPKAMLYSVVIVTITYLAVSFATVVSVKAGDPGLGGDAPWRWIGSFKHTGFGQAVAKLMPSAYTGHLLVTLAVVFSATSALNATIYSATRASYALGRDRMLPEVLARISPKRKTPYVALGMTGVIVLVVAGLLPIADVASCASMMFLLLFFLVNFCVIRIRLNMGDELSYGYLMPFFPIPAVAAIIAQGALAANIIHMSPLAWMIAPGWILGGVFLYMFYSRSHAVATEDEIMVFEQHEAPAGDQYRIMIAVANPANALELVRTTYQLCGAKNARVELLHMVPVPEQVPLADAGRYMLEGKEGIIETMLYLAPQFPLSTHVRYCRSRARGIVSAVREKKINMLIMGWHGGTGARGFFLGSTVDPVIERCPCNVVIMKDCGGNRTFKRILVPVAGGTNAALALEVAAILADPDEGRIVAFTVDGRRRFQLEAFVNANLTRLSIPPERVERKIVEARNVTEAILTEAEEAYDLVVMGATARPRLATLTRDTVPETVAHRCPTPLVMVKASGRIQSWIKRWV